MPTSDQILREKLAKLNPDKDCVAIFKPGDGVAFYVPDSFKEMVKEGQPLPAYVLAVLVHVHLYRYFDSDPTIREFVQKVKDQIHLDFMASDEPENPI